MAPLRIGFVPEHFSTPLHFAAKYFSLSAQLIPFPSGTGHMVTALRAGELDIAVGLTEGWIAALASSSQSSNSQLNTENDDFKIVGTYVESPLCWAISTGRARDDINCVEDLKGKTLGLSRIGSGSYVMGFVLADREGWLLRSPSSSSPESNNHHPFEEIKPLQTFEKLRQAVNGRSADFFLWEYFTSKRYYGSGPISYPIKQVGEIYTPWSSWMIVARGKLVGGSELEEVLEKVNAGVRYFEENREEA
ncbi:MAG: hypothetical protein Q9225_007638, partial [Loekoesia sp. 1 TL-2023]